MKHKNLVVLTIILTLLLFAGVIYGILVGRIFNSDIHDSIDIGTTIQSRVSIGEKREYALQELSDAWFHARCQLTPTSPIEDIFFYGANDPEEVEIVIIKSQKDDDTAYVTFVGTIENYMLHLYDHCKPLPSTAFSKPQ